MGRGGGRDHGEVASSSRELPESPSFFGSQRPERDLADDLVFLNSVVRKETKKSFAGNRATLRGALYLDRGVQKHGKEWELRGRVGRGRSKPRPFPAP